MRHSARSFLLIGKDIGSVAIDAAEPSPNKRLKLTAQRLMRYSVAFS